MACCGGVQKCYSDFELQGVIETVLNSRVYQTISSRLQVGDVQCFDSSLANIGVRFCRHNTAQLAGALLHKNRCTVVLSNVRRERWTDALYVDRCVVW